MVQWPAMRTGRCHLPVVSLLVLGSMCCRCRGGGDATPMDTIDAILSVYGAEGRSNATRAEQVSEAELVRLFVDYRDFDPFLANLYVGFVAGALARQRDDLAIDRQGARAVVTAGRLPVVLRKLGGRWQVHLASTIPAAVKARARMEHARLTGTPLPTRRP